MSKPLKQLLSEMTMTQLNKLKIEVNKTKSTGQDKTTWYRLINHEILKKEKEKRNKKYRKNLKKGIILRKAVN